MTAEFLHVFTLTQSTAFRQQKKDYHSISISVLQIYYHQAIRNRVYGIRTQGVYRSDVFTTSVILQDPYDMITHTVNIQQKEVAFHFKDQT